MKAATDMTKCRCGCGGSAYAIVQTPDYDPAYPNGMKPAPDEPVCVDAYHYLRESAAELGFPFKTVRAIRLAVEGRR